MRHGASVEAACFDDLAVVEHVERLREEHDGLRATRVVLEELCHVARVFADDDPAVLVPVVLRDLRSRRRPGAERLLYRRRLGALLENMACAQMATETPCRYLSGTRCQAWRTCSPHGPVVEICKCSAPHGGFARPGGRADVHTPRTGSSRPGCSWRYVRGIDLHELLQPLLRGPQAHEEVSVGAAHYQGLSGTRPSHRVMGR